MKLYHDRNWLYRKYWIEELSLEKIAKTCRAGHGTIHRYMCKFKIKRRNFSELTKGSKNPNYGKKHSEKTRRKISKARQGKIASKETKQKYSEQRKLEKNANWKGGKFISRGYLYILKPEHPYAQKCGYVAEHRLIMEKVLGRFLKPNEIPHHKNEIRDDNRPFNLSLFSTHQEHLKFHRELKKRRTEYE